MGGLFGIDKNRGDMIFFDSQRLSDLRLAVLADLKDIIPPGYYDFVEASRRTHYDVELTQKARKLEQNSSLSPRLSAAREVLLNYAIYQLSIQRLCTKCSAYIDNQDGIIDRLKEEISFLWKASKNLIESVRYWSSYLPEIERDIFNCDSLGYSTDLAEKRIVSFYGVKFEFLSNHIGVLGGKFVAKAATQAPLNGVDKKTIALKFQGIYWSESQWNKRLASPPKWLQECRVSRGTKSSKKNPSIWNPVDIAIALTDKDVSTKKLDAVFVDLNTWRDEWELKSEYLR